MSWEFGLPFSLSGSCREGKVIGHIGLQGGIVTCVKDVVVLA